MFTVQDMKTELRPYASIDDDGKISIMIPHGYEGGGVTVDENTSAADLRKVLEDPRLAEASVEAAAEAGIRRREDAKPDAEERPFENHTPEQILEEIWKSVAILSAEIEVSDDGI